MKGLEPDVVRRLSEQAAAEGVSQQEWIRRVLRRTAGRLSPAELAEQRKAADPMTEAEFDRVRARAASRRRAAIGRLDGRQRRR